MQRLRLASLAALYLLLLSLIPVPGPAEIAGVPMGTASACAQEPGDVLCPPEDERRPGLDCKEDSGETRPGPPSGPPDPNEAGNAACDVLAEVCSHCSFFNPGPCLACAIHAAACG